MESINTELNKIKSKILQYEEKKLDKESAFEYLSSYLFCYKNKDIEDCIRDISSGMTNGSNDGGIDFVYYDDENDKVLICQCKSTENMQLNDVVSELNKMSSTVENFKKMNSGQYNHLLKYSLQNALDRLPEGCEWNIEYTIFTLTEFDPIKLEDKIQNDQNTYLKNMVNIIMLSDFNSAIKNLNENIKTVLSDSLEIDKPKNYLTYETANIEGILVNVSSNSIVKLYNKHKDEGLFDMNIRKYIRNKTVDDGIKNTLDKNRENFWFLNNGLIIACENFEIDGNKIKLTNFSIVNGGQTTNRIGNYKGSNTQEFFVPCKIISVKQENQFLYNKIAEATNSQKPITARDLKANSPEMKTLQNWLLNENIYLEIKRGELIEKGVKYKLKNDEFGQFMISFVHQLPGTARSGKKKIFETEKHYNEIFLQNYEKSSNKKSFIVDLISFQDTLLHISDNLLRSQKLTSDQKNTLKNGRFVILSLMGVCYRISNNDLTVGDFINYPKKLTSTDFEYGRFVSNYKEDDYESKISDLVTSFVIDLTNQYIIEAELGKVTSVSNLFKTDKKYAETIAVKCIQNQVLFSEENFNSRISIFKR